MNDKPEQTFAVTSISNIPYTRVSDLLVGAFEGGCNYWMETADAVKPTEITYQHEPGHTWPRYDYPLNEGGAVDCVDDEGNHHRLDLPAIKKGLQLMAEKQPKDFADFMDGNDDASTSDVFVQLCLFGDVIYG